MKINELVKIVYEHPFVTTMLIGAIVNGVVRIVEAVKRSDEKPSQVIAISEPVESEEET